MIGVMIFSVIMIGKVIPYLSFEHAINFLGTKPDTVLDKNQFMWAFYIHIISSVVVMPLGVLQFSSWLIRNYPKVHRNFGKIYIIAILLFAAPSGLVIANYANGGLSSQVGFSLQSITWWIITLMAWKAARQHTWDKHISAMLRSFAVTLAAMSLRTESYLMYYYLDTKPIETYLTVTWSSWVGNLLFVELLIELGLTRALWRDYSKRQ